jgi:hypothetical protein
MAFNFTSNIHEMLEYWIYISWIFDVKLNATVLYIASTVIYSIFQHFMDIWCKVKCHCPIYSFNCDIFNIHEMLEYWIHHSYIGQWHLTLHQISMKCWNIEYITVEAIYRTITVIYLIFQHFMDIWCKVKCHCPIYSFNCDIFNIPTFHGYLM